MEKCLQGQSHVFQGRAQLPCSFRRYRSAHLDVSRVTLRSLGHRVAPRITTALAMAPSVSIQAEDQWINSTLLATGGDTNGTPRPAVLEEVRSSCLEAARTMRMPTTRNEEYRFTDITPLLQKQIMAAPAAADSAIKAASVLLPKHGLEGAVQLVVVDGTVCTQLSSNLDQLPGGVFLGSVADAPAHSVKHLGQQGISRGGPFALLNGAMASDAVSLVVDEGVKVEVPIHILYAASGSSLSSTALLSSSPRLYASVGRGASVTVFEEFVSLDGSDAAFTNAVAEFDLHENSEVALGYVQFESSVSYHTRATLVSQHASSSFRLCEVSLGAKLSRHDISIHQAGESTTTSMHSFLLCGEGQLHDLHSKMRLNHPKGEAQQLHKCIVTHASGRGVFDGNVKVERLAQQTDAQQLSRNLLLVPKATVSVKPNLQIIADDVKCTHGCTVSDLEEEQLFYFLARGIPKEEARKTLVYSFGAEVVQKLGNKELVKRVQEQVTKRLETATV